MLPSQTNFLLVKPPRFSAEQWHRKLRTRNILVRWFQAREVRDYLRITIGLREENAAVVNGLKGFMV